MGKTAKFNVGLRKLIWLPVITGLVSIGLGIWCLVAPMASMEVFAYVFAGCLCAAGVLNLWLAMGNSTIGWNWGWALALGLIELLCGIWLFTLPAPVLTSAFVFIIGVWIIIAAINALCESFVMASVSPVWIGWSIVLLIATIILAFIFLSSPVAGGIAVWLWIGISLILFGVYRLVFAGTMRKIRRMSENML